MQRVYIRIVPPGELGIYSQILRVPLIQKERWRKEEVWVPCVCEWKGKCPDDTWRHCKLKGFSWGRCTCGNVTVTTETTNGKFQGEVRQDLMQLVNISISLSQISLFCSKDTSICKLLMWTSPQYFYAGESGLNLCTNSLLLIKFHFIGNSNFYWKRILFL